MHGRKDPWGSDDHAPAGHSQWRPVPPEGHPDGYRDDTPTVAGAGRGDGTGPIHDWFEGPGGRGFNGFSVPGQRPAAADRPGSFNGFAVADKHPAELEPYRNGYDHGGPDQRAICPPDSYPQDSYERTAGHDRAAYDPTGRDRAGYDRPGYAGDGYAQDAYPRDAYAGDTYPRDGYEQGAFQQDGYERDGYERDGYEQGGHPQDRYGRQGYAGQPGVPAGDGYGGRSHQGRDLADDRRFPDDRDFPNSGDISRDRDGYPGYDNVPVVAEARLAAWDGLDARDRFDIRDRRQPDDGPRHESDDTTLLAGAGAGGRSRRGRGLPGPLGLAALVAVLLLAFGVGTVLLRPDLTGGDSSSGSSRDSLNDDRGLPPDGLLGTDPTGAPTATPTATPTAAPSPTAAPTQAPSPRRTTTKPRPKPSPSKTKTIPISANAAAENKVLELTNAQRAKNGCPALKMDERLRTGARGHSRDMANNDYFEHTSPSGKTPWQWALDAGYPENRAMGENIAMGQPTPAEVVKAWMNSEGHRANILNCGYHSIGVGLVYDYQRDGQKVNLPIWTQLFGSE